MSSMYFHSPSGEVKVRGTERAYFRWLCNRTMLAILDLGRDTESRPHPLRYAFPADHYVSRSHGREWAMDAETAIVTGMSDEDSLVIGDHRSSFGAVALNTAVAIGGDQLKLAARLHGQCELHAFVEGSNRAWLANIIEDGLRRGIFRTNSGWESGIELLRSSSGEPGVTSYSGCEQFPNSGVAIQTSVWSPPETTDEDDGDDVWYDLPMSEQWRLAMDALRIQNRRYRIELKPEDWENYRFGDGLTAFDVMAYYNSLNLSRSE